MGEKFEVLFLEDALEFLRAVDEKTRIKILYNIDKAKILNDPKLFKKLSGDIWEFRTRHNSLQCRLLAFWDHAETQTLVISTHGIVKKTDKVPPREIARAIELRRLYFEQKDL